MSSYQFKPRNKFLMRSNTGSTSSEGDEDVSEDESTLMVTQGREKSTLVPVVATPASGSHGGPRGTSGSSVAGDETTAVVQQPAVAS